jgi:hypothetical protein
MVATAGALTALMAVPAEARVPRTYPFGPPRELRAPKRSDALPGFYADGGLCSRGCRPFGAVRAWPVKPFHGRHTLVSGLNEIRPGNLHVGVDILAADGSPVYALEPGRAHIIAATGRDSRVQVGRFIYWHIRPRVAEGQYVRPLTEVVGTINSNTGHVHLSEIRGDRYLNPLRPGGRVLEPWSDTGRPVLGRPAFGRGARAVIKAFDPQSPRSAPVLGLAGLAYRLFDRRGRRVGRLHWIFRGTRHLPNSLRSRIYAPGTRRAFATCAALPRPCRPRWVYRLGRLPVRSGRIYRLSVYGWDWAGRASAIDTRFVIVRGEAFFSPRR